MARAQGYTCDLDTCDTFEARTDGEFPPTWLRLRLPGTTIDRPGDRDRDFCTTRCLERFARDRRRAEDGTADAPSTLSPALASFLEDLGITGRKRGSVVGNHARHHAVNTSDDCAVCLYEAEHGSAA